MAFNVTVKFTGLLMFVRNTNPRSRAKMAAVLVDARKESTGLDRRPLRLHKGTLQVNPATGGPTPWILGRERILFDVTELPSSAGTSPNEFYPTTEKDPTREFPSTGDLSYDWVLNMERVDPDLVLDRKILDAAPPQGLVLAQVPMDRGKLRMLVKTPISWRYRNLLHNGTYVQAFAHTVALEMEQLESAVVRSVSFDRQQPIRYLDLADHVQQGRVEVLIDNNCDCLADPDCPIPDRDTRWFFEFAAARRKQVLKAVLDSSGAELPVPWPHRKNPAGGPGSTNCIPARGPAQFFTVPEWD
jgi:hypothetical protein